LIPSFPVRILLDPLSGKSGAPHTVRRYRGKLLIKPAKAAVRRIRERLRTEMRSLRGASAQAVIARLNPIVRGSPGAAGPLHDVA